MIQLDQRIIGFINVFEKITRANVKDCFEENGILIFVVQEGQIRKAIGKGGDNIKRISGLTKKKIKVIEFSQNVIKFVKTLLYPLKVEVELGEEVIVIKSKDHREKGQIYGRDRTNLKRIQNIVDKYFNVKIVVE